MRRRCISAFNEWQAHRPSLVPRCTCSIQQRLASADILIDAILGTGLSTLTGMYREAIEALNAAGRPTVAVDLPSGLHADTGSVLGAAVRADLTVTFGLPKVGLYCGAGIDCAGLVRLVDIGIPTSFIEAVGSRLLLLTGSAAQPHCPIAGHLRTREPMGTSDSSPDRSARPARRRWQPSPRFGSNRSRHGRRSFKRQ